MYHVIYFYRIGRICAIPHKQILQYLINAYFKIMKNLTILDDIRFLKTRDFHTHSRSKF